ncbi:MAG: hypothetical protein KDI32_03850 [Pseudomonadales bacterium]|nr:hypothetical protein [Pseudomonadales bacterium]
MTTLGPIACVTIAARQVQPLIDAYSLYLGYGLVDTGLVSEQEATLWNRPALAGRRFAMMLPGGDGKTYIRFVESKPDPNYVAFRHFGWNAAELMVQDTDKAAEQLADSPFRIIGPPADLSFSDKIRAMQALGPANESLYLTSFKERLPEFDTPEPKHFIDRTFIVIVGGKSIDAMNAFYSKHFGVAKAAAIPGVISVISAAHGLPHDTQHKLAALTLSGQSFIEADEMPKGTLPRLSTTELPSAIAMVSFGVKQLPESIDSWLAPPQNVATPPYHGRRARVCEGAAGEWIELIEQ